MRDEEPNQSKADAPKVVRLSAKPESGKPSATMKEPPSRLRWSFLLFALVPIFVGAVYFGAFASDRYTSHAGFAVRGVGGGSAGGLDGIGAITGLASTGTTTSDSYIILKYISSRDLLERLQAEVDLKLIYSAESIDPLSRLRPDASIETLTAYWERRVHTSFDATSGIVNFEVQAFSAEDAFKIATLVLQYTDELVNQLSESARRDSVRFAETEVARAEERLRQALQEIRSFRAQEQSINPVASAQLDIELTGELEGQLIDLRARLASIRDSLDENAPPIVSLRRQIEAVEAQLAERAAGIGFSTNAASEPRLAMTDQLAIFETLEVEKTFAQEAYQSALTSLEQARAEADRQQRYLAVFSQPALPQEPTYPMRLQSIGVLVVVVLCIWGIATLIIYAVRDHLS